MYSKVTRSILARIDKNTNKAADLLREITKLKYDNELAGNCIMNAYHDELIPKSEYLMLCEKLGEALKLTPRR